MKILTILPLVALLSSSAWGQGALPLSGTAGGGKNNLTTIQVENFCSTSSWDWGKGKWVCASEEKITLEQVQKMAQRCSSHVAPGSYLTLQGGRPTWIYEIGWEKCQIISDKLSEMREADRERQEMIAMANRIERGKP